MGYYEFFASRPEKVTVQYIEAVLEMDYEKIIDCFDPATQSAMKGINGLFSSFAGFALNDVMAVAPLLQEEEANCHIESVEVVSYMGIDAYENLREYPMLYNLVGTFLGSEAEVEFIIISDDIGKKSQCRMIVKRFGMEWLIPGDEDLTYL